MRNYLDCCLLVVLVVWQAMVECSESNPHVSTTHQETHSTSNFSTRMISTISKTVDCKCVPFYQCLNGTFNKHGIALINYKSGVPTFVYIRNALQPERCEKLETWCCIDSPNGSNGRLPDDGGHEEPKSTISTPAESGSFPVEPNLGCGYRNKALTIQYKVVGKNNEAQPNEFPWMVMIMSKSEFDPEIVRYQCGGSLIHERVVLTAAHCAAKIDHRTAVVRAGEHDTRVDEKEPYQDRSVAKILTHPAYDEDSLNNDISLLVTTEPFKFASNINILCLPTKNEVIVDGGCLVAGWGKDMNGDTRQVLKKTTLPVVPRDECLSKLRKIDELGPDFELHESFICAGGVKGQDTCQGDGGSPLICTVSGSNDRYRQVGIVSWGVGCGQALPAVYVNVAKFRTWIDGSMEDLNFTTNYSVSKTLTTGPITATVKL